MTVSGVTEGAEGLVWSSWWAVQLPPGPGLHCSSTSLSRSCGLLRLNCHSVLRKRIVALGPLVGFRAHLAPSWVLPAPHGPCERTEGWGVARVPYDCHREVSQTGWPNGIGTYCPTVPQTGSVTRRGCWPRRFLLEAPKDSPSSPLS